MTKTELLLSVHILQGNQYKIAEENKEMIQFKLDGIELKTYEIPKDCKIWTYQSREPQGTIIVLGSTNPKNIKRVENELKQLLPRNKRTKTGFFNMNFDKVMYTKG